MRPGGLILILGGALFVGLTIHAIVTWMPAETEQVRTEITASSGLPSHFNHRTEGDTHYFDGYITLPHACFRITQTSSAATGTPPQMTIFISAREISNLCVPVVTREPVSMRVRAPEDAQFLFRLGGEPLKAELTHVVAQATSTASGDRSLVRVPLSVGSNACTALLCPRGWEVSNDDGCACTIDLNEATDGQCVYSTTTPCESLCEDEADRCADDFGCGCLFRRDP